MTPLISPSELPYLTAQPDGGRVIVVMPNYDHSTSSFHCYAAQPGGMYFPLRPIKMVSGLYVSTAPADCDNDIHLPFAESIFQYFSKPEIWPFVEHLGHDIQNGLASLHKYFVLLRYARDTNDVTAGSLLSTEIEYAIGNHRSFYDLLHRVVTTVNQTYHSNPKNLKDSFASLAQRDVNYLCEELSLPAPLAVFYASRSKVFLLLRDLRDNIYHHGHSPETISLHPEGFAVRTAGQFHSQLKALGVWPTKLLKPNQIGSALAVLSFIVRDMFDAFEGLGVALMSSFDKLPLAVADGHHVYLRSPLGRHFHLLSTYQNKHWFNPDEILMHFTSKTLPDE